MCACFRPMCAGTSPHPQLRQRKQQHYIVYIKHVHREISHPTNGQTDSNAFLRLPSTEESTRRGCAGSLGSLLCQVQKQVTSRSRSALTSSSCWRTKTTLRARSIRFTRSHLVSKIWIFGGRYLPAREGGGGEGGGFALVR